MMTENVMDNRRCIVDMSDAKSPSRAGVVGGYSGVERTTNPSSPANNSQCARDVLGEG
jgi:hypothetical protein